VSAVSTQLGEELLRRFAAALRSAQLYSVGHPIIERNTKAFSETIQRIHNLEPSVVLGIVGDEIIVDDKPASKGENLGGLVRRLKQIAVERVIIDRGVTTDEVAGFLKTVTTLEPRNGASVPSFPTLPHIRVGRVQVEERTESATADIAAFKQMYRDAVTAAGTIWESARTEKQPDATQARSMIDGLAQAVSQNRTALLALTTLRNHDDYTFTHMVNVSILTMGQARGLGIDGPLLRELGLAALMHDIGKVQTPLEILNKIDPLTEPEFAVLRRHPVDGAEMLRATPDIPTLAPVVAFEHHMRLDGGGYPSTARRDSLNLGTMLCSIADVYDAMRSQRRYQQAFPSERILEVLKRNDGRQFDRHLVRRFVQLVGIYPAGSLVRLNTGEIAAVVTIYAPDPNRPHVKVIVDASGAKLSEPQDIHLWDCVEGNGGPSVIAAPVDPVDIGIDPLTLLDAR
jgi:putative nucleotidyltransferase with HDIG domain